MLSLNEIKLGKILQINNEPYVVIKSDHHKVARGGAVLKTKLKNLINHNVIEKTWQGNDKAQQAEVVKKKANFIYQDQNSAYFMDNETYEQFNILLNQINGKNKFLKENTDVDIMYFNNQPVSIELPIKIDLKVIQAPPGIKGNSAGNVMKTIELETGLKIQAPLFINQGDIVRINTETGEYAERI
ncbi:MAG: elongation factor P [bacterium]